MNHKQKQKRARKMMTPEEIANHTSIWDSKQWQLRKAIISEHMKEIGTKGGNSLKSKMPPDYYQKISAMGNAKKAELKKLKEEAPRQTQHND